VASKRNGNQSEWGLTIPHNPFHASTVGLRQAAQAAFASPGTRPQGGKAVTEIGIPDPLEPEIEIVPAVDPVPGPVEVPEPVPAPAREPDRVPA
jgi:hypothetical protein